MNRPFIESAIHLFYEKNPSAKSIIDKIVDTGGKPLLVGGAVRDAFLGIQPKDFDVEVYSLTLAQLEPILATFGSINNVGKSFGVIKINSLAIDWSIPRSDSIGRMPTVVTDPFMKYEKSFARRDLTINAMGIDLTTNTLVDPFNGLNDLKNRIARAPDINRFVEDPLRLFRVMQFVGRFNLEPDLALNNACKTMPTEGVSAERISDEYRKLILFSDKPSKGFIWLQSIGRLQNLLPELHSTINTIQDKRWHPEGNVFTHTMQTLDAAVIIAHAQLSSDEQKLALCCAALCHDLGKVSTTCEDEKGVHSYGHAQVGAPIATKLLNRMFHDQKILKKTVYTLVYYHMMPGALVRSNARLSRYQLLAAKLEPHVTMHQLGLLAFADRQGRNSASSEPLNHYDDEIKLFLEKAEEAHVLHKKVPALLTAEDLIPSRLEGKELGKLLKKAYDIQIDQEITEKAVLKNKVLKIKN